MPIRVLHADAHAVVVEKPAGLLSVPGRLPENKDCVVSRLQVQFADAFTVHRLDQVTSGVMLFARGKAMQSALARLFERREVAKRYEALVEGLMEDGEGRIDLPMICDWPNRPRQKVDYVAGKPALTHWRVLERDVTAMRTRVQLEPVTGRSHQLRLHMASIGHPIVGDAFYGAQASSRVCLHATGLAFLHPVTAESMHWSSPAPF